MKEVTYYSSDGAPCPVCGSAIHRYRVSERGSVDSFCCSCRARDSFFVPNEVIADAAAVARAHRDRRPVASAAGSGATSFDPASPPLRRAVGAG